MRACVFLKTILVFAGSLQGDVQIAGPRLALHGLELLPGHAPPAGDAPDVAEGGAALDQTVGRHDGQLGTCTTTRREGNVRPGFLGYFNLFGALYQ